MKGEERPGAGRDRVGGLPRRLPVVVLGGRCFFRDERLGEYRAVDDPHVRFGIDEVDEEDGKEDEEKEVMPERGG